MRFITREDILANNYRRVEAMYRKGFGSQEIARSTNLSIFDVLDIMQKVFALDVKKERRLGSCE